MAFQYDAVKSQRVDLQQSNTMKVGAGEGDDVYVIDAQNFPVGNKTIIIEDLKADGNNKLVLVGGLEIVSSKVYANALELTLSNNIVVQVLGASTFLFQTGGAVFTGAGGLTQSYADFVTQSLGTTLPAAGSATPSTGSAVTVNTNGGGTSVTPPAATYALTGAASADEGSTATFALSTTNVAAGTQVPYTLSGIEAADLASGSLTGMATVGADGKAAITVDLAADATTEGAENLVVTLDGKNISATTAVNDTSTTPVAAFSLTASAASVDEGASVTFTVNAGQPNFTYNYELSGVDADDVTGGLLTGSVTTDINGDATFTVALANDRTTEGVETLVATLPNTGLSASVTVNDTSLDNIAPVAEDATGATTEAGAVVAGQLVATDAENDALTFALDAAVEGLTFNPDGTYSFDPSLNTTAQDLKYTSAPLDVVANYTVTDALGATDTGTLTITVTPKPLTFEITADKTSAEEGATTVYKVKASEAVNAATDVVFTLQPGDGVAVDTGTTNTNTADFATGAFNPTTVTIAAGSDTALFNVVAVNDAKTELQEGYSVKAEVAGQPILTLGGKVVDATGAGGVGQTFTLTTGVDSVGGTSPNLLGSANSFGTDGDDSIVALLGTGATLGGLDQVNGGLGTNAMTVNADGAVAALPATATISNIQTMTLRGTANLGTVGVNDTLDDANAANTSETATAAFDVSGVTGLTALNVTLGTSASLKAAITTDVSVSGVTGGIEVDGGKTVTVTDATANNSITVGSTVVAGAATGNANTVGTAAAGAITVTDTNQGSGVFQIDGGTSVTVTATTDKASSGAITVGALKAASGAVVVTQNTTNNANAAITAGPISVTGGSTVTVNANLTNTSSKDSTAANNITAGNITVLGDSKTTAVTVKQVSVATDYAAVTTGATNETSAITFASLKSGEKIAISANALTALGTDLTFTASQDLTAAEVAAVFANLTAADLQTSGGKVANGIFTGQLDAGWTTGAVSGSTVTFTATTTGDQANEITLTVKKADGVTNVDNLASFTTVKVDGSAGTSTTARNVTADYGDVTVDDNATEAITTISLNGFEDATLGSTGSLDALTTLNLSNASDADVSLSTTSKTLALNLDNFYTEDLALDGTSIETLTITTTGTSSDIDLEHDVLKFLTIDAGVALIIDNGSDYEDVLETVTIKGAGAVDLDDITGAVNLDSFSAASNTGGVTATVQVDDTDLTGDITEYIFSQGNDVVTLEADTGTVSQIKVTLGAGDDTADLSTGDIATLTKAIDGGTGTNTIKLTAAVAETATQSATFEAQITNFSKLSIDTAASQEVVDLANMDDISYVIAAGSTGTAQVVTLTDAAAKNAGTTKYEAGDVITVTVNGYTVDYTVVAGDVDADDTDLNTNIVAAINGDAKIGGLVSAVATNASVITLTADLAGTPLTATMAFTTDKSANGTDTFTPATTTANVYGLTLNNMANNGTVKLTATGAVLVSMTDATGSIDVLNVVTEADWDVDAGVLTVNDVETVNLTATDSNVDEDDDGITYEAGDRDTSTLALYADSATTVSVAGNGNVTLTTFVADLETINATTMAGVLTYTASVDGVTVNAGSGADALTADGDDVNLYGNDGADTLTVNSGLRVNLYGGAGADTFVFNTDASATLDAYTVINSVASGDTIKMTGADSFQSTKIALSVGADETLLNYANQATKVLGEDDMGWFQKGGNTYIVMDTDNTDGDAFVAGTDMIVMITGLVDLSTASYNATTNTLEIA